MGSAYLLAVVGGVLHTMQVNVWPSVKVTVLSADTAVPSVPWLALAAVHGLGKDAQVDAVCIPMAVVAPVLAGVTGFADLTKITLLKKKKLEAANLQATGTVSE